MTGTKTNRSFARSFLSTLTVMGVLSAIVLATAMDRDALADSSAPLTGLQTLQMMTAPTGAL